MTKAPYIGDWRAVDAPEPRPEDLSLDDTVWQLWVYARQHAYSLSSSHHVAAMLQSIQDVLADKQQHLDDVRAAFRESEKALAVSKKNLKACRQRLAQAQAERDRLEWTLGTFDSESY